MMLLVFQEFIITPVEFFIFFYGIWLKGKVNNGYEIWRDLALSTYQTILFALGL